MRASGLLGESELHGSVRVNLSVKQLVVEHRGGVRIKEDARWTFLDGLVARLGSVDWREGETRLLCGPGLADAQSGLLCGDVLFGDLGDHFGCVVGQGQHVVLLFVSVIAKRPLFRTSRAITSRGVGAPVTATGGGLLVSREYDALPVTHGLCNSVQRSGCQQNWPIRLSLTNYPRGCPPMQASGAPGSLTTRSSTRASRAPWSPRRQRYAPVMSTGGRPQGNTLPVGTSRLGFVIDGDTSSPDMATLLENDGDAIRLTIPWQHRYGDEYRRWFSGEGAQYGDDPDQSSYRYDVPTSLEFVDRLGHLTLVGCRVAGYNNNLGTRMGAGRIRADYAVLGGRGGTRYEKIHGLRSELMGLGDWMGLRSLTQSVERDENRLTTANLRLKAPAPIRISRQLNLRVAPSFSISRSGPDATTLRERMYVETRVKSARDWDDHLALHRAVRDLVSLSSWHESRFTGLHAIRDDNPTRALSGDPIDQKWNPVEGHLTRGDPTDDGDPPRSLFTYQDTGSAGVAAWIRLRSHFSRGIDPIISSLYSQSTVQTQLAAVAIGFEALGYQLALDAGVAKKQAGNETIHDRLLRVGNEVSLPLPFDVAGWARRTSDAYNGIKHANRAEVDVINALNASRESVLLFRLWVATRVSATGQRVVEQVQSDRMSDPYIAG